MQKVDVRIRRSVIEKAGYKSVHKVWKHLPDGVNEVVVKNCKLFTPHEVIGNRDYITLPGGGSLMADQVDLL